MLQPKHGLAVNTGLRSQHRYAGLFVQISNVISNFIRSFHQSIKWKAGRLGPPLSPKDILKIPNNQSKQDSPRFSSQHCFPHNSTTKHTMSEGLGGNCFSKGDKGDDEPPRGNSGGAAPGTNTGTSTGGSGGGGASGGGGGSSSTKGASQGGAKK
ncbi:hypothetical protein F4859DRAFT_12189 [Xylaria cf. heliscus]|nr:hypothetical protein F4859DRAFT_12189 [Xylaria cf. heliscus]